MKRQIIQRVARIAAIKPFVAFGLYGIDTGQAGASQQVVQPNAYPCKTVVSETNNAFDGILTSNETPSGAKAYINDYFPAICDGSGGIPGNSSAWVMITDDSRPYTAPGCTLAQSGWLSTSSNSYGGTPYYAAPFYEYGNTSVCNLPVQVPNAATLTPGGTHEYQVYDTVINRTPCTAFYVDTVLMACKNTGGWTANSAQFLAERHHSNDQIPGDTGTEEKFYSVESDISGAWYNEPANLPVNQSPGDGGFTPGPSNDPNKFFVWDPNCNPTCSY